MGKLFFYLRICQRRYICFLSWSGDVWRPVVTRPDGDRSPDRSMPPPCMPPDFHHPLLNDFKKMSEKSRGNPEAGHRAGGRRMGCGGGKSGGDRQSEHPLASVTGMQRAVRRLDPRPDFLLIDGNRFRPFDGYGFNSYRTVVHGDATYSSIAAASVLAKTWRDERMRQLAKDYPEYGWDREMGYPTKEHIEAIPEVRAYPLAQAFVPPEGTGAHIILRPLVRVHPRSSG